MPGSSRLQAAVCGIWVEVAQAKYWRRGPYPDSSTARMRTRTSWALTCKTTARDSLRRAIGKPACLKEAVRKRWDSQ